MRRISFFCISLFTVFIFSRCVHNADGFPLVAEQNAEADASNNTDSSKMNKAILSPLENPEYIFSVFKTAYPNKIVSYYFSEDDWVLELQNGMRFFWAHGRILPENLRNNWQDYKKYPLYAYTGQPRDPDKLSETIIRQILESSSPKQRALEQTSQEAYFLASIFEAKDQMTIEKSIVKTFFLGKRVNVNNTILIPLKRVHEKILQAAQSDSEVAAFVSSIIEVGGYNWRNISGTSRLSNHSYGAAIDFMFKGYQRKAAYWEWEKNRNTNWFLIPQAKLWQPPAVVIDFFKDEGFVWGGTWALYDTIHFEYRPELIELGKLIHSSSPSLY